MLRGIRIVLIFSLAIIVGYAAGELKGTSSNEQKAGLTALLLVSIAGLIMLGVRESKQLKKPRKKKYRFRPTHHTNGSAVEAGCSSFYSRPSEEAWRVRKQQSGRQRRASKPYM